MTNSRVGRWGVLLCFTLLVAVGGGLCAAGRQGKVDAASLDRSAAQLRERVLHAVRDAGGDPEHQQLHLVLGFSTGHYAVDPLGAEAARGIARRLITGLLIRGDCVSVYAWETHLWTTPRTTENPVTLTTDDPTVKAKVQDLFPLTPRTGSQGGHDTEQALVEITNRIGDDPNAVIVLFTNSAASISPPHGAVIGADDPAYQAIFTKWRRLTSTASTGATMALPYTPTPAGRRRPVLRMVDVVLLTPRQFTGEPIPSGTRSSHLRVHTPRMASASPWGILALVLGLIGVGVALRYAIPRLGQRTGWLLDVAGQRFDVQSAADGEEICHLTGPGYPSTTDRTVTVAADIGAPPIRLARFIRLRGMVRVQADGFKLHSVDGVIQTGSYLLRPEERHRLVFQGEAYPDPALPPRQVRVEIDAQLACITPNGRKDA